MAKKVLPQKHRIFNLLRPFKAPPTTWDRIYDWLLNRARVIMVVAEILVVIAFVSKVAVDIQAKNLDESITKSQATLNQFAQTAEPEVRKLQQKAESYRKIWNESSNYSKVMREIHSYIPTPTSDIVIRIDGTAVTIRGDSSIDELVQIEAKMRASATFTNVTLPTLSSESSEVSAGSGKYVFNAQIAQGLVRDQI
jgi:Tfp pilus assembly protein PilN